MTRTPARKRKIKGKTRKPTHLELKAKGKINSEISTYSKKLHTNQAIP